MRRTARLRRLEREMRPALGREVRFPGRTHEEAEREAQAMIERGEIAPDDMVVGFRIGEVHIVPPELVIARLEAAKTSMNGGTR